MPRKPTGQVIERHSATGTSYALRFHAYGRRHYLALGSAAHGWSRERAERELRHILTDVERGVWVPPVAGTTPAQRDPTFHEFASEWFASVEGGLRPKTVVDYRWQLTDHLLPFFANHRLRQIDVREVDRYRDTKLREGRIGAESINKTLTRLGQILERAVEYELIARNPVRIGKRKLRTPKAKGSYIDDAGQVADLLAAAADLDRTADRDKRHLPRRALVATLAFTGLRIGEMTALRWRHIDLAGARLLVDDAKTPTGVRHVTIQPALLDELTEWKARAQFTAPSDPVFATTTGRPLSTDNIRRRTFNRAVEHANELRDAEDLPPLPDGLTPHSLRRTYISALLALGWEVPVVMAEVGHASPNVTLSIYAQVMRRDAAARDRLAALLEGRLKGTIGHWTVDKPGQPDLHGSDPTHEIADEHWADDEWARPGSNGRPSACKATPRPPNTMNTGGRKAQKRL